MTSKFMIRQSTLMVVGIAVATLLLLTPRAYAATCTFTRDLNLGVTGEDVRCLQQHLNSSGYTIAATGPGSAGNETGEFKTLTEAAVKKWQEAKGITPVTGTFGPMSRALYRTEQAGTGTVLGVETSTSASSPVAPSQLQTILTRLAALERRIEALEGKRPATSTTPPSQAEAKPVTGGVADQADAALDDLDTAIIEAEDEIAEADDDGERVDYAEDLLEEVIGMFDQAESLFKDKNYERVLTITKRAMPLVVDAVKAIGKRSGDENNDDDEAEALEDRLDDLRKDLDDVRDDVESALDDDEDVGDAESLLDEAEDLLDDAEDALDDDDESEAEDLLDEAEDLIKDAEDEL